MKNNLIRPFRLLATAAAILAAWACQDDVDLPMPTLRMSTPTLVAPSFATTLSFSVDSNCDWEITVEGAETSWVELSETSAVGNATIEAALTKNDTQTSRSVTITARSLSHPDVKDVLTVTQGAAAAEGYITIPDLKALAAEGDYTVPDEVKMRGTVVSSVEDNNYFEHCIALQGSPEPGTGITLRLDDIHYYNIGEELEVDLKGAVVSRSAQNGVMELKPVSDDRARRTETSQVILDATTITYEQLMSGVYESMYVGVYSQVYVEEGHSLDGMKVMDGLTMQTPDNDRFALIADQTASFGINAAPTGSGTLKGIAVPHDRTVGIRPCTENDLRLTGIRFGASIGIKLPYVFSFYASSQANKDCKYITIKDGTFDKQGTDFKAEDKDNNICAVLTARAIGRTSSDFRMTHWADEGAHDNIPAKSMVAGQNCYFLLTLPLAQDMPAKFRVSFGLSGTGGAPRDWVLAYSNDNETFITPDDNSTAISVTQPISSSGFFFYYTVPLTPTINLTKGQTLYLKLYPTGKTSVNGGTAGYNSDSRLHSCFAIEAIPSFRTAKPAGALYFEPFDNLTEGLDYLLGDKLAAMANYCGSDITSWAPSVKNGISGENVRQRPGYAQIGYVETQAVARNAYKNSPGYLLTPALGTAGDLNLSFKAMAYKTFSDRPKGKAGEPADKKGDLTTIVVEVTGGGTIGGATRTSVENLSTTAFNNYTLKIEGATASTRIKFTSDAASGEFSRWFIDDICVTK